MRMYAESGLWISGHVDTELPVLAVLEVSGAVLSWTVDSADPPQIAFTDTGRADWLWRVLGETGHVALLGAMDADPGPYSTVDVDAVEISLDALQIPRRLAVGHWLRRWWPSSVRDSIAALDAALLDAEVAVLTVGAQDFFSTGTIDSEVDTLLAPHAAAYLRHIRSDDHRVVDLVSRAVEIAIDTGLDAAAGDGGIWLELAALLDVSRPPAAVGVPRQDDYALAAGPSATVGGLPIARGTASINWGGVPPHVFDAAEGTATWSVEAAPVAIVTTVLTGVVDPSGIVVSLRSGHLSGTAGLDGAGGARIPLISADAAPTVSELWDHDWSATVLTVGTPITESATTRERVRSYVRARLASPPPDAFLAEILVAESDY